MFDPPHTDDWFFTGSFEQVFAEAYKQGYEAAKNGASENTNPHTSSGHERDTTYEDELRYWWWIGWNGFSHD